MFILIILNVFALITLSFSLTYFIFERLHMLFNPAYMFSILLLKEILDKRDKKEFLYFLIYLLVLGSILLFEKEIFENQSSYCKGNRISPYVSIFNKEDYSGVNKFASECS